MILDNLRGARKRKPQITYEKLEEPGHLPSLLVMFSSTYFMPFRNESQPDISHGRSVELGSIERLLNERNETKSKEAKPNASENFHKEEFLTQLAHYAPKNADLSPKAAHIDALKQEKLLSKNDTDSLLILPRKDSELQNLQQRSLNEEHINNQGSGLVNVSNFCARDSSPKKKDPQVEENCDCIICLDNKADIVVMDCGHGGLCRECAFKHWDRSQQCHLCRKEFKELLQVHPDLIDQKYMKVIAGYRRVVKLGGSNTDKISRYEENLTIEGALHEEDSESSGEFQT